MGVLHAWPAWRSPRRSGLASVRRLLSRAPRATGSRSSRPVYSIAGNLASGTSGGVRRRQRERSRAARRTPPVPIPDLPGTRATRMSAVACRRHRSPAAPAASGFGATTTTNSTNGSWGLDISCGGTATLHIPKAGAVTKVATCTITSWRPARASTSATFTNGSPGKLTVSGTVPISHLAGSDARTCRRRRSRRPTTSSPTRPSRPRTVVVTEVPI